MGDIGVSFRYPASWRHESTDGAHTFEGPTGARLIIFSASRDELPEFTLADWQLQQLHYWQSNGTILAEASTTVGGADSHRLTVQPNGDEATHRVICEGFIHGDLAYGLAWTSDVGEEASDLAVFEEVVDSLVFIPIQATPTPSADGSPPPAAWIDYVGHGVRLSRPADWSVHETSTVVEIAAPDGITWLHIANHGSAPGITAELLADATLVDARENLDSADAASTRITLGGVEAVVVRFHNTGDTGIEYYRLKVIAIHDGEWFEMVLYTRAGHETAGEEYLKSFVESLEFMD